MVKGVTMDLKQLRSFVQVADLASISKAAERLHIAHEGSATGTLTISVGAATGVPGECDSAEVLLKAAEAQRRLAKLAGRNRVSAVVVHRENAGA